jgi:hypothetical protein
LRNTATIVGALAISLLAITPPAQAEDRSASRETSLVQPADRSVDVETPTPAPSNEIQVFRPGAASGGAGHGEEIPQNLGPVTVYSARCEEIDYGYCACVFDPNIVSLCKTNTCNNYCL